MDILNIRLDGTSVQATGGESIMDAAARAGVRIPSLCYLKEINCISSCRMCIVEVNGRRMPACSTKVQEGMEVRIFTKELEDLRKKVLENICSHHRQDCGACRRFPYCELHTLCRQYGLDDRKNMFARPAEYMDCGPHLIRDNSKCISCMRCAAVCEKVMGIGAIAVFGEGKERRVQHLYSMNAEDSSCIHCGQCMLACPTGALMEKSSVHEVAVQLSQRKKVIAVVTPEACAQLAGYFGTEESTAQGKTTALLRRLGFSAVYSVEYGKESIALAYTREIKRRIGKGEAGLISTYCPGVDRYLKAQFPQYEDRSVALPPPQMISALHWREHFAQEAGVPLQEVQTVILSSCTADKHERSLSDYRTKIQYMLTTHELYELTMLACVSSYSAHEVWKNLSKESYDSGEDSDIETDTGMALMLRIAENMGMQLTAVERVDRKGQFLELRCTDGETRIRFARISGLARIQDLLRHPEQMERYAYIEAMACPGGCIHGAGESRQFSGDRARSGEMGRIRDQR